MINDVILNVLPFYDNSVFIMGEIKNILNGYIRKKDYVYLIKPESITAIARHPSGLINSYPVLEQISQSYNNTTINIR